jgi:hypothetical protein
LLPNLTSCMFGSIISLSSLALLFANLFSSSPVYSW